MNIVDLVHGISNVGLTIFCVVAMILLVRWLDRNVFNKNRYK